MDSVMGIFCVVDENNQLIRWNKNYESVTGFTTFELLRMNAMETIAPEEHASVKNALGTIFDETLPCIIETKIQTRDGRKIPYLITSVTTLIGNRKYRVFLGVDITKRKKAEKALQREKALLAGLLDSIPDLIFFKDTQGVYLGCNPEFSHHLGRARHDIVGHTDFDLYPEELARTFRENDTQTLQSGAPRHDEEWIDYPDGSRILVDTLKSSLVSTDGSHIGILGISRDITERKNAEELLRKSEEKYRRFVETANEGVCAVDRNFLVTFANQKMTDILGWSVDEIVGKHISRSMHPDEQGDVNARIQNRLAGKKEIYERRFIKKDGTTCWLLVSVTPLMTPDGIFEGSFAMLTDITGRKEAERVLRESEERFRHLIDLVPGLAVQGYYLDGTTFYWNKASERLYGYTAEEAIGRNLLDLIIPPEMQEGVKGAIAGMAVSGRPIPSSDLSLMRKDGTRVDVFSGHAIVSIPGKASQLFCMDIDLTERKQAELAIRQSDDRFEQVANNADEWIWEVDADGVYQYCSAAVERILGYTPDEIVGTMHYYDLFPATVREELTRLTMDGFARREPFRRFINPAVHKAGNTVILETSATAAYDDEGRFIGYRGCDLDVTERRNMEIARQAALEQIEMNIGQLAMLGDRIRNPLTAILAYAGLMAPEAEEKIAAQVTEIDQTITRIDQGWIESEKIRLFLRKHSDISLPEKPEPVPDIPAEAAEAEDRRS
jgi:PAS domain S-box-containing protein